MIALKRVPGAKEFGPLLRIKEGHSHKPGATLVQLTFWFQAPVQGGSQKPWLVGSLCLCSLLGPYPKTENLLISATTLFEILLALSCLGVLCCFSTGGAKRNFSGLGKTGLVKLLLNKCDPNPRNHIQFLCNKPCPIPTKSSSDCCLRSWFSKDRRSMFVLGLHRCLFMVLWVRWECRGLEQRMQIPTWLPSTMPVEKIAYAAEPSEGLFRRGRRPESLQPMLRTPTLHIWPDAPRGEKMESRALVRDSCGRARALAGRRTSTVHVSTALLHFESSCGCIRVTTCPRYLAAAERTAATEHYLFSLWYSTVDMLCDSLAREVVLSWTYISPLCFSSFGL